MRLWPRTEMQASIIISSEKNQHFFWRNNEALVAWTDSCMLHYSSEKKSIFSEEIMRHLSASPQHSWGCTVFGSLHAPHYFCKKKMRILLGRSTAPTHQLHPTTCQASSCMPASSQQRRTISSTKLQAFSWNNNAPEHLFHQQVPHYFFRKNDHFFWRNNEACWKLAGTMCASLFLQKKWSFFSEEIMMHAGNFTQQSLLHYFFRKKSSASASPRKKRSRFS